MTICEHPENEYFDYVPDPALASGDIVQIDPGPKLMCKAKQYVIVSPSCDLAQRKGDTITVLPLITVNQYLGKPIMFYAEIRKRILKITPDKIKDELPRTIHGTFEYCSRFEETLSPDEKTRLKCLLDWLSIIDHYDLNEIDSSKIVECIGKKEYTDILRNIINDNYKPDIYYLPPTKKDKKDKINIKSGAIVLLRNSIALPFELFELAYSSESDWNQIKRENHFKCNDYFVDCPLKIGAIKPKYYNDLYAKYLAYQVRIGSPDFTDAFVTLVGKEIYPEGDL